MQPPRYPNGETGMPSRYLVEGWCPNEECEAHGVRVELLAFQELGWADLENEAEGFCSECGTELEFG